MRTFRHSGHFGDFVYGLATVKAAGGGMIVVDHRRELPCKPPLPEQWGRWMVDLAAAQPYATARFALPEEQPDFDLDAFRSHPEVYAKPLALTHWESVGQPGKLDLQRSWLETSPEAVAPIVIHWKRTWFEHDAGFAWSLLASRSRDCVFVGHPYEHRDFGQEFGWSPEYYGTADLISLTRVIAGSTLFIGVASLPLAIAEALKIPRVACQPRTFCNTQLSGADGYETLDQKVLARYGL